VELVEPVELPFISVVVPTWNQKGLLVSAVASLRSQDYPSCRFDVIVVDDGSRRDPTEAIGPANPEGPDVWIIRIPHGGVNSARNAGIQAARGDLICFLDDDEVAPPGWLGAYAEAAIAHPDIDAFGAGNITYGVERIRRCDDCGPAGTGTVSALSLGGLMGGNMAIRRSTFDRVGLFPPGLSGNGDDSAWFALNSRQLELLEVPDAWTFHRRDTMGLVEGVGKSFRQGRGWPASAKMMGVEVTRYRPGYFWRCVGHGLLRRCGGGYAGAAHHLGVRVGLIRQWRVSERTPAHSRLRRWLRPPRP
jgi:glycosyltransferase involved in cell wall biosynthesis